MKKEIVGYLPRLLYKFYLRLKEKFDNRPPITEEEQYSVDICMKLIGDAPSSLTFAPISNKRFIKNDEKDMFVVIDNRFINLINHIYSYSVYIENDELYSKMISVFDTVLEEKRLELEKEIKSNIVHSLKSILDKIS